MHDIPRKDREDADDIDEDEVADVSGGYIDPESGCIPLPPDYPQYPGLPDPVDPVFPPEPKPPYFE